MQAYMFKSYHVLYQTYKILSANVVPLSFD
jgi:hypothetical protein